MTSHTSLPSHTGPIALRKTRRSSSLPHDQQVQHADAEVEAVEDDVAGEQDAHEGEPDRVQIELAEAHVAPPSDGSEAQRPFAGGLQVAVVRPVPDLVVEQKDEDREEQQVNQAEHHDRGRHLVRP